MAVIDTVLEESAPLVAFLKSAVNNTQAVGEQTTVIYDTAWVSMVRKPGPSQDELLFPECFQFILDHQLPHGGWASYDAPIDGIMNTLGALLALKKNVNVSNLHLGREELLCRTSRAVQHLQHELEAWDVSTADHVGFEIVIPSILKLLAEEGIEFEFPGYTQLMTLNRAKLSKIPYSVWSKPMQTTLTHSLESFIGQVSFDELEHLLVYGSMGSSPAATSAYLIYSSKWNSDAETYLRQLVANRTRDGIFIGIPTMFPSTGFETLWVASTLLEYGFDAQRLPDLASMVGITSEFFDAQDGLASGFSNLSVPDADDTAKAILVRNLLGVPTTPEKLIARFEGSDHFLTYGMERHPSLTTNCNVLSAMLESPEPAQWIDQIEKCARFLIASWTRPDMPFTDKWNISELYPTMLVSEALIRLVKLWDDGMLSNLADDLIERDLPLVLFQLIMRILQKQQTNGSWGHKPSLEMTAYAIIALTNLGSLPFFGHFSIHVKAAVERGRIYIQLAERIPDNEYIWIAKTMYSPILISKAYILSAMAAKYPKYTLSHSFTELVSLPRKGIEQYVRLYSGLPCLIDAPLWRIQGSVIEGYLHMRKLQQVRIDMFGRPNMKKDDYFEFIAMTFACANNLRGAFLKASVIFEMMVMVLRVYQVDEYVEHVIGGQSGAHVEESKKIVDRIFQRTHSGHNCPSFKNSTSSNKHTNGYVKPTKDHVSDVDGEVKPTSRDMDVSNNIHHDLSAFVCSILCNPFVRAAKESDRDLLAYELHQCLLAHVTQIEDSKQFLGGETLQRLVPKGSFYNWVRTTAASHSCAPLSLAFLRCLSAKLKRRSTSPLEQYLVQDLWTHFSTKARMENDRASLRRDRKEKNLNSLDFPEFGNDTKALGIASDKQQKAALSSIVEYERRCIEYGLGTLEKVTAAESERPDLEALKFYGFLCDIYSDVYAMKDISCER
ncbi:Ent-kaurene synthase [Decorospora gaudefroyi]|uniref:Ent-kaurene synthase n=1 Tax=Decorospora gaudefroyi TaxID=184978 RepID=A0A6A5K5E6_9PLEO|nr:Ent-kaurene synthase [Decorospora gaudefroyi]